MELNQNSKAYSKKQIEKIKDGALIVRLYLKNPKLKALQKLAASPDLSAKQRSDYAKAYETLKKDREAFTVSIVQAFENNYDYSKVYYVPDSLFKQFIEDKSSNVFISPDTYQLDEMITLDTSDFIVFTTGEPDYKYQLLDHKLQELQKPKRYYGVFSGSFLSFLPFIKSVEQGRIKAIQNLNKHFFEIHEAQN